MRLLFVLLLLAAAQFPRCERPRLAVPPVSAAVAW
jgi:hypothetical protein